MDWNAVGALATIITLLVVIIIDWDRLKSRFVSGSAGQADDKAQTRESSVTTAIIRSTIRWGIGGAILYTIIELIPRVYTTLIVPYYQLPPLNFVVAWMYLGFIIGAVVKLLLFSLQKGYQWLNRYQEHSSNIPNWGKSGNLWWLSRDISVAIRLIDSSNATKREIDHYLLKCHHHAKKAMFDDSIVNRLEYLKSEARNFSQENWTSTKRREFVQSLISITNDIGTIAERKQPDFDPGPSLI